MLLEELLGIEKYDTILLKCKRLRLSVVRTIKKILNLASIQPYSTGLPKNRFFTISILLEFSALREKRTSSMRKGTAYKPQKPS